MTHAILACSNARNVLLLGTQLWTKFCTKIKKNCFLMAQGNICGDMPPANMVFAGKFNSPMNTSALSEKSISFKIEYYVSKNQNI